MTLRKMGGLAGLFCAAAFIFGFSVFIAVLGPAQYGSAGVDPTHHIAFLAANRPLMSLFNLVIYIAFGAALVVLALAIHQRIRAGAEGLSAVALAFALIWAGLVIASGMVANIGMGVMIDLLGRDPTAAAAVWPSYTIMINGLGGGNEIVGGLWVLLISLAAFRAAALPRLLNLLGGIVGVSGLLTTIPDLGELGSVFGLGTILWFAWLGAVLLRGDPVETAAPPA